MFQKTGQAESRSKEEQLLEPKNLARKRTKIIHSLKDLAKLQEIQKVSGNFVTHHSFQVHQTKLTTFNTTATLVAKRRKNSSGRFVHARFFGAASKFKRAKLSAFLALANLPSGFSLRTSILGGGGLPLIFFAGLSSTNDGFSSWSTRWWESSRFSFSTISSKSSAFLLLTYGVGTRRLARLSNLSSSAITALIVAPFAEGGFEVSGLKLKGRSERNVKSPDGGARLGEGDGCNGGTIMERGRSRTGYSTGGSGTGSTG